MFYFLGLGLVKCQYFALNGFQPFLQGKLFYMVRFYFTFCENALLGGRNHILNVHLRIMYSLLTLALISYHRH